MATSQNCHSIVRQRYLQTVSFSTFGKCKHGDKCFSKSCKFSHPCWKQCMFDKSCKNDLCRFQHTVNFCKSLPECVTSNANMTLVECPQTGKEYCCFIQKVTKTDGTIVYVAFTTNCDSS